MPITQSAKKALRNSARKRVFNLLRQNSIKNAVKKLKKFIAEKKTEEARKFMSVAGKAIDKAAKTGFLKKNTASRKKSRLSALIKKSK